MRAKCARHAQDGTDAASSTLAMACAFLLCGLELIQKVLGETGISARRAEIVISPDVAFGRM
jgi:hypothetical protein